MKLLLSCSLIALSMVAAAPVMAQGIYVGPGGVSVDGGRDYRRDYGRDRYDGYDAYREGRSAYRRGPVNTDDDDDD